MIAIDLALITGKTNGADALVSVYQVSTLSAILTWLRGTFVDVDVTILAGVTSRAATMIIVNEIDAQCTVLTLSHAIIYVLRAVLAIKAASTPTSTNLSFVLLLHDEDNA